MPQIFILNFQTINFQYFTVEIAYSSLGHMLLKTAVDMIRLIVANGSDVHIGSKT